MIDVDSQNVEKVPDTWKSAGATAGNFDNQCPKVKKLPFRSLSFYHCLDQLIIMISSSLMYLWVEDTITQKKNCALLGDRQEKETETRIAADGTTEIILTPVNEVSASC